MFFSSVSSSFPFHILNDLIQDAWKLDTIIFYVLSKWFLLPQWCCGYGPIMFGLRLLFILGLVTGKSSNGCRLCDHVGHTPHTPTRGEGTWCGHIIQQCQCEVQQKQPAWKAWGSESCLISLNLPWCVFDSFCFYLSLHYLIFTGPYWVLLGLISDTTTCWASFSQPRST